MDVKIITNLTSFRSECIQHIVSNISKARLFATVLFYHTQQQGIITGSFQLEKTLKRVQPLIN